jgi:hypothetical protein
MPLLGLLTMYRDEFEAHINGRTCPTGDCPIGEPVRLAAAAAD